MTRATPVVVRHPDSQGRLVTYLTLSQLCETVGIHNSTLLRWAHVGAVRVTRPLNGGRNYALADAARLRRLTPAQRRERGLTLTSAEELRKKKEWYHAEQETTTPAEHHRDHWDEFDLCEVLDLLEEGRSNETIALRLGRTYASVCCVIERLRIGGDLARPERDTDWWERTRPLLTPDERVGLEDVADRE